MKVGTEKEMQMINSLSEAIVYDGSSQAIKQVKNLLEDMLGITDDEYKLANAQIDEENHLHSLSSSKGINFRE
jgi:transcriptional regulator CtsR